MDNAKAIKPANAPEWVTGITADMLPLNMRPLADVIGIEQMLNLIEQFGGETIYIPKLDALLKTARDKMIKQEYTGYNTKELAKKYDLTVRWVQKICENSQFAGQVSVMDMLKESGSSTE
jgi:Mor family transcriptional regulator